MKATIEIEMDNAAFEDANGMELARILRELAQYVEAGSTEQKLRDFNGNIVGKFEIED